MWIVTYLDGKKISFHITSCENDVWSLCERTSRKRGATFTSPAIFPDHLQPSLEPI